MLILINLNNYEFKFDESKEMFFTNLEDTKNEIDNALYGIDSEKLIDPYFNHRLVVLYLWAGSKTKVIYDKMVSLEVKEQERVMTFGNKSYLVTNEIKDMASDTNKIYWKTEEI